MAKRKDKLAGKLGWEQQITPQPVESQEDEPEVEADMAEVAEEEEATDEEPQKRDRSWDAARSRATYDLPPSLIEDIREITREITKNWGKVRVSDVARLLLEAGITQYRAGNLTIQPRPTRFSLFDE